MCHISIRIGNRTNAGPFFDRAGVDRLFPSILLYFPQSFFGTNFGCYVFPGICCDILASPMLFLGIYHRISTTSHYERHVTKLQTTSQCVFSSAPNLEDATPSFNLVVFLLCRFIRALEQFSTTICQSNSRLSQ